MIAGGLAAVVCAVFLDERDLLRLGAFIAVLPVFSWLLALATRPRISGTRAVFPDRLEPGVSGSVQLTVRNTARRRSPRFRLTDAATEGLSAGTTCTVPALDPGASGVTHYPLTATRRGRFRLGALTAASTDALGLVRSIITIPSSTDAIVVPPVVPLAGVPPASGLDSAASSTERGASMVGDLDVIVRPYIAGDDIRSMHWAATARRDEPVVRNREAVSHGGATILLDYRHGAHRGSLADSSLETGISLVASLGLHLLAQDFTLSLVGHDGRHLSERCTTGDDVLVTLADVLPDPHKPLTADSLRTSGLVIAVLGALTEKDALTVAQHGSRSAPGIAYLLDTNEWSQPGEQPQRRARGDSARSAQEDASARADGAVTPAPLDRVTAILTAAGWRVTILHRGQNPAEVWRTGAEVRSTAGQPV